MLSKRVRDIIWPLAITLGIIVLVTWGYLIRFPFLQELELKSFDLRMRARGAMVGSTQVGIVAIDEQSLEKVGRWPWSRETMARLVRRLDAFTPRGVGYDISFFDPEKNPAQNEIVRLAQNAEKLGLVPSPGFMVYLKGRLQATNPDLALALALQNCTAPQILGYYFNFSRDARTIATTLETAATYPLLKNVGTQPGRELPLPLVVKARTNIPLLARAARWQAFFNIIPDSDGTIRSYNLAIRYGQHIYQPLAAALACLTNTRKPPTIIAGSLGMIGVQLGDRYVPCNESGRVILNYRGPEKSIPHIPAWKILQGDVDTGAWADKFLLVGVTAPAVYDLRVTPFGVAYPGLEVQATALDNMLKGDFMSRPGWAPMFDIAAIITLSLVCLGCLWRIRPVLSLVGFLVLFAGYILLNQYFFVKRLYWLNLVYPLVAFSLCYLGLNVYRFIFADRQKRQIRQAFSKYLDPNVVNDVVDDPEKLCLGGVKHELTVLFSDIRGFTSISEKLSPEALVRLLNEYLSEMTDIVMKNRGLLDKYIGDAVMAVFGAPRHYPEHPVMACRVGLEMISRLKELNAHWQTQDWNGEKLPAMEIGVGINTGPMVAGNMGSKDRFDYTVMGDNVNLGSRLEGLNKVYGTHIIISQSTLDQVQDLFWVRCLDRVRVKGKDEPVAIYELIEERMPDRPCSVTYLREYEQARRMYEMGRFQQAKTAFAALGSAHPDDPVVHMYAGRVAQLLTSLPQNWDGVYTFTTK